MTARRPLVIVSGQVQELPVGDVADGTDFDHVTFPAANFIGTVAHLYTLSDLMNHEWSSGVVDGGLLTDNGNGTISIAEAVSTIRADTNPHGTLYGVATPAQLNIALTDNATNYIYLNYAGVSTAFAVTTTETIPNGLDKVLAYEVHRYGNLLHYIDQRNQTVDSIRKSAKLQAEIIRFTRTAGGSTLGAIGLALTLTAGGFHRRFESLPHVAFDTSIAGTANANIFVLWNHVAGVYTSTENSKVIDTTLYDNGTNTALLSLNNFGVSWIYVVNDSPSELHVVMGQVDYAKLSDAVLATPPAILPTLVSGFGVLVGFVIYERGVVAFDDVRTAFTQTFGTSVPTQHNGLAGIQTTSLLPNDNFHLSLSHATDLTDGGDSILHYHSTDRARANHTGTQSADTLTDGTTNKVYTATEQTRLANTSGTNTGDQNLSGYALLSGATFSGAISATNLSGTNTGDQTSVTGNAGTVTTIDAAADTTTWPMLATSQTGSLSPATDAELTYNASTNLLGASISGNAATANLLGKQWSGYATTNTTATVLFPSDAVHANATSVVTGAFKIKIPTVFSSTNTMIKMRIELLDYTANEYLTFSIGGYMTTALTWTNETVLILSGNNTKNFTVRFGNDGVDRCIWIGELTDTWSYPKIYISEVMATYNTSCTVANLSSGWSLSTVVAFDTVEDTISNNFPIAKEAFALKTATTTVQVSAATAPTTGQVLTATSSTVATWQTPAEHITAAQAADLTDGGDSILHYHSTDRALGNATGTLAIGNGGTGQTTAVAAFDALAPTTTQGDIIYHNGTDNVRLAKGTASQVLTINAGATAPEWAAAGGGSSTNWPIVKQSIGVGETCTITAGFQLIVAKSFANSGTLVNNGELYII